MNKFEVAFYGGVGSVTGANFLLETSDARVLVDCGMTQGSEIAEARNRDSFPYDPQSVNFLFITHAHIDHIGKVPKLVKDGFRGTIYSTSETKELAKLMLKDAARISENNSKEKGVLPIYDQNDVMKAFAIWQTINYHEQKKLGDHLEVEAFDSGHILGSSMYLFSFDNGHGKRSILFTGDLGNSPSLLLPDTEFVENANYIVMDSVYGDRNHEPKQEREKKFKETILETISRRGVLLIPAFSLERTQTILYEINNLVEDGQVPAVPVFLDSPLAIEITKIYERVTTLYNGDVQKDISGGDRIFDFPKLKETVKAWDSKKIDDSPNPKIIIAGSGMSTAGRILQHETRFLPDSNATILLVGYQASNTLGRMLQDGAKEVLIDDKKVQVKARIITIDGYSAHKDSDHLIEFIEHANTGLLRKVFVVMGEPKSSLFLAQRLRDYVEVEAVVPESGKIYKLE